MVSESNSLDSVCVYCGSSNGAAQEYLDAAARFGRILAAEGVRLVYGGGGVGLMGACAGAAHRAGGRVLGVIPEFLTSHERPLSEVETIVVQSMHERKMIMYEEAEAFARPPHSVYVACPVPPVSGASAPSKTRRSASLSGRDRCVAVSNATSTASARDSTVSPSLMSLASVYDEVPTRVTQVRTTYGSARNRIGLR